MLAILTAATAMLATATPQVRQSPAENLSVMSYNVRGLPWPFALGRPTALRSIGERLGAMRREGREPRIVLLQEAFTSDAKSIAREGNYPYVVSGPSRVANDGVSEPSSARPSIRKGNRLKGESEGAVEDSGLLVLSDYPILDIKRLAYSRYACAGFDCLANKGVLLVRIAVPGASQPLTIIDTHMNSRGASGVGPRRADTAFGWQARELRAFVTSNVPDSAPAIVAGDLNIGKVAYRQEMITGGGGLLSGAEDAIRTSLSEGLDVEGKQDASKIADRGKDWMFARSGNVTQLRLKAVAVPFGREPNGKALSDHFGYVAYYALANVSGLAGSGGGSAPKRAPADYPSTGSHKEHEGAASPNVAARTD